VTVNLSVPEATELLLCAVSVERRWHHSSRWHIQPQLYVNG